MVSIAICENRFEIADIVNEMIYKSAKEIGIMIETTIFSDTETLCRNIEFGVSFDIYIIDKDFKDRYCDNILDFIRNDRELDKAQIILLVKQNETDISLFKEDIMSYITKPITQEDISRVMKWFYKVYYNPQKTFSVSYRKNKWYFDPNMIVFFESENRTIKLHTKNHVYRYYGYLKDIINHEKYPYFIRVHQSYIINIFYVEEFNSESVTLIEKKVIPISKRYKELFLLTIQGDVDKSKSPKTKL